MKKRHFTMLELVVIVGIVAVFAAFLVRISTTEKKPSVVDNRNELNTKVVGTIDRWWPIYKFALEGHEYFYVNGGNHVHTVWHNENCHCRQNSESRKMMIDGHEYILMTNGQSSAAVHSESCYCKK